MIETGFIFGEAWLFVFLMAMLIFATNRLRSIGTDPGATWRGFKDASHKDEHEADEVLSPGSRRD